MGDTTRREEGARREAPRNLEEMLERVEERIRAELVKRLGKSVQYTATISLKRGDALEVGIDLRIYSSTAALQALGRIAEEVIDAGFEELEKLLEEAGERSCGRGEEGGSGHSVPSISRS